MNIERKYLLSWQDRVLGPHSVEEIKSLLSDRKIHSLFKVKSDGSEVLVREFLASLNDDRKRASAAQAEAVVAPPAAVIGATADHEGHQAASEATVAGKSENPPPPPTGGEAKFGYAATSLKPPTYLWQSIVCTLLCCLPFGVVGIVFAAKVNSLAAAGNMPAALEASNKAKFWCWMSFGIWLAFVGLYMLLLFAGVNVLSY